MDVRKLIKEVEKYPVLYDLSQKNRGSRDEKEMAWKTVAANLDLFDDVDTCKKKWFNIRKNFRRIVKRRKTASGQACEQYSTYIYEDLLSFLVPHLAEQEEISNVLCCTEKEDINEPKQLTDIPNKCLEAKSSTINDHDINECDIENLEHSLESLRRVFESCSSICSFSTPRKLDRLKRKISANQTESELTIEPLDMETKKEQLAKKPKLTETVDAFLIGITSRLKSLDSSALHQAQKHILSVIKHFQKKQVINSSDSIEQPFSLSTGSSSTVILENCEALSPQMKQ